MRHYLWETKEWKLATQQEVLDALFNPPPSIDESDLAEIDKYHPGIRARYLELFYERSKPEQIQQLNATIEMQELRSRCHELINQICRMKESNKLLRAVIRTLEMTAGYKANRRNRENNGS